MAGTRWIVIEDLDVALGTSAALAVVRPSTTSPPAEDGRPGSTLVLTILADDASGTPRMHLLVCDLLRIFRETTEASMTYERVTLGGSVCSGGPATRRASRSPQRRNRRAPHTELGRLGS